MSHISQPSSQVRNPAGAVAFARSNRAAAIVIGVLAVALGILVGHFNPLLRGASSTEGAEIDRLFGVLLGIATTVFVVVQGGLLYAIVRFRRSSADDESEGAPTRGSTGLEILWTAIPAALVTGLAIYSYGVLADIEQPSPDALTVEVTGRQFSWEFYYPEYDVHATDLHAPVGRQVYLKLRSADVVHSFWVPDFRIKKDLMPDRITELRFTPDKDGTYPVVCSRLCGAGHAFMRSSVIVQEPADFQAWMDQQMGGQDQAGAGDPAVVGRQLFQKYGCVACHTLSDAQAAGQVGPNLNGIGSRAGSRVAGETAEQYIQESIVKPNAYIVPGYQANVMPQDFGQQMSDKELQSLVQYLSMQK